MVQNIGGWRNCSRPRPAQIIAMIDGRPWSIMIYMIQCPVYGYVDYLLVVAFTNRCLLALIDNVFACDWKYYAVHINSDALWEKSASMSSSIVIQHSIWSSQGQIINVPGTVPPLKAMTEIMLHFVLWDKHCSAIFCVVQSVRIRGNT